MHSTARLFLVRFTWMALLLAGAAPVAAVTAPPPGAGKAQPGRMLDARVNFKEAFRSATAARAGTAGAARSLSASGTAAIASAIAARAVTQPGLQVRLSNLSGGPESVRDRTGALSAPAPGRSTEAIVRGFLQRNGDLYGLSAADQADLVVLGDSPGGASGLRMLRLEQQIDGRPVFQSETRFVVDRAGRLIKSVGLMIPHARALAAAASAARFMAPEAAVAKLLAAEGRTVDPATYTIAAQSDGRIELNGDDGYTAGPIAARQVLFPLAPGLLVPAWSLVAFTTGEQDWYAIVDAETGDLLWRKGIRDYASAHDARFRVYVQADGVTPADNPAPQSPATVAPGAGTQFPKIAPALVSMHAAMNPAASPNGWIDDCPGGGCTADQTQTLGNNALACLDRTQGANANLCDTDAGGVLDGNGRPTGNPDPDARERDFLGIAPRDFQTNYLPAPQGGDPEAGQTATGAGASGTLAVDQFRRGVVTHLFYVTNWYHDKLHQLGFDEASGNFQHTNFSGMGLGNDRVRADAQDGSGTNNANFATPPDGTSGRMQMYRFTGPTIDRDGSLDAEIVIHELTHGTSNRLVGNGAGLNWDPARGMGEGWSDFYALSLLNNTNADNPAGRYASGAYATYKLGGLLDNYLYGIRRFPYSTDHAVNPLTWADADDVTNDLAGGIAADPLGFNLNGGMEVHNSGELWALTLWGVRARVIADPAGANGDVPAGNQATLQLVTDAMKMTPLDPTFIDGRDALVEADCATNACANETSIWNGFANRGLGYGAAAPFRVLGRYVRSHEAVKESFAVPHLDVANALTDVTIDDSASNDNGAIDPGEAIRIAVKLTNPWRAAARTATGATATLSTATPGITIYDNSAAWGAIAPQGTATGDPFTFTVEPAVAAGTAIDFTLDIVSNIGSATVKFRLRVGARNGTDPAITYTGTPVPALTILSNRPRGVFHQIDIADDYEIADLDFRIDSIATTAAGDLTAMLRSPQGIGVDLVTLIDGLNDLGGTSIAGMVIDDDVAAIAANDMVQATLADAPYARSWLPAYNSPWAALVDADLPADPVGALSRYDGMSTLGTWSAHVADVWSAASGGRDGNGTFGGWSMLVTPVHFDVAGFVPGVVLTATKTVAGTFRVGQSVTYTVRLTNTGTANQADNAGNEFTDVLPVGLTLAGTTATSGTALASVGTNTVTWNGSLAPLGGSVDITITATIDAGTLGATIGNQGTAAYDADAMDGSNEATLLTDDPAISGTADPTTFVVQYANLTGTKTVNGTTFAAGSTVTYTVVLANTGNAASLDNAGNELLDALPAGLTLVSAAATAGTAVANVGANTVTWNGSVPAGGSVTITIGATVDANATGTLGNQGTVNYDSELDGGNETTVLTGDPRAPGAASGPTIIFVQARPIPALDLAGMIVLGLALLGLAGMALRRRDGGRGG